MKGTRLYSILKGKCPVCHQGDLYQRKNPYLPGTTLKMHEVCSNCGTRYKIEPSFFYGAMYVSYALGVALAVASFIIAYFIIGLNRLNTFFAIVGTLVVFLPVIARLSRNIWLNFFFKFDKDKTK